MVNVKYLDRFTLQLSTSWTGRSLKKTDPRSKIVHVLAWRGRLSAAGRYATQNTVACLLATYSCSCKLFVPLKNPGSAIQLVRYATDKTASCYCITSYRNFLKTAAPPETIWIWKHAMASRTAEFKYVWRPQGSIRLCCTTSCSWHRSRRDTITAALRMKCQLRQRTYVRLSRIDWDKTTRYTASIATPGTLKILFADNYISCFRIAMQV